MKFTCPSLALAVCTLALAACNKQPTPEELQSQIKQSVADQVKQALAEQSIFQAIPAKITIADKQVDSVVEWNTKTGEARLLNAASFADKATGQQGNLIGWVPLTDLNQAVQNLAAQIQAQQANKAQAAPASTPIKAKTNE